MSREKLMVKTSDIHSLTDFQRNARVHIDRLRETGRPEVLTVNGRAELVVPDAAAYQELVDRVDRAAGDRRDRAWSGLDAARRGATGEGRAQGASSAARRRDTGGVVYPVRTEPSALEDVARHYRYLQENDPSSGYADEWFELIQEAILSLGEFPLRFGLAPENDAFEEEIRHRIVGSYRVLFTIHEGRVHVLHVRHARQDVLRPEH